MGRIVWVGLWTFATIACSGATIGSGSGSEGGAASSDDAQGGRSGSSGAGSSGSGSTGASSSSGTAGSSASGSSGGGSSSGGPGGGDACTATGGCPTGEICGFPTANGCAAQGSCFPAPGVTCLAYAAGCACDGTEINVACTGLPSGYATKPLLHTGACAQVDASSACTSDSQCATGLKCCYPCGVAGCTNQCITPLPSGACPMYP